MGGILQICYLLFAIYCSFSDCYIPHRKISSALANSSAPACLPHHRLVRHISAAYSKPLPSRCRAVSESFPSRFRAVYEPLSSRCRAVSEPFTVLHHRITIIYPYDNHRIAPVFSINTPYTIYTAYIYFLLIFCLGMQVFICCVNTTKFGA